MFILFRPFILVLSLLAFCVYAFTAGEFDGISVADQKDNKRIELLRASLESHYSPALYKKLLRIHKKRVRKDPGNTVKISEFVQDDLKYGDSAYALHLLILNQNRLTLAELNVDPARQGKFVRINPFTLNIFRRLLNMILGKHEDYFFDKMKAEMLLNEISKVTLTSEEKQKYGELRKIVFPEPEAAVEKIEQSSQVESQGNMEEPVKGESVPSDESVPFQTFSVKTEEVSIAPPVEETVQPEEKKQPEPPREKYLAEEVKNERVSSVLEIVQKEKETGPVISEQKKEPLAEIPAVSRQGSEQTVSAPAAEKSLKKGAGETTLKKVTKQKKSAVSIKHEERYFWEIVKVIKDVFVQSKDTQNWIALKQGDRVFEGDVLKTGEKSSVLLHIRGLNNKDSFTQLFENTELKVIKLSKNNLDQLDDVYLDLIMGEVLVNVEKLPQASQFKIKTPTAVAGVRGTTFNIQVLSDTVSRILLLNGHLEVFMQTIQGMMTQMMNPGEKLVSDFNIPENIPFKEDEATLSEYSQKAQEVAEEIVKILPAAREQSSDGVNEDETDQADAEQKESAEPESTGDDQPEEQGGAAAEDTDSDDNQGPGNGSGGEGGDQQGQAGEATGGDSSGSTLAAESPEMGPAAPVSKAPSMTFSSPQPVIWDPMDPSNSAYDPALDANNYYNNTLYDDTLNPEQDESLTGGDALISGEDPLITEEALVQEYETEFAKDEPVFGVPGAVDHQFFVDSLRGSDSGGNGTPENPWASLVYAMNQASTLSADKYVLINLFSDSSQQYAIPAGGLKMRPRTGITGFEPNPVNSYPNKALLPGNGTTKVIYSNAGPVYIANVEICNNNTGIGIDFLNSAGVVSHTLITDCASGVRVNGLGSDAIPSNGEFGFTPPDPNDPETGVIFQESVIQNCDLGMEMNASPGVFDMFGSTIQNCGIAAVMLPDGPSYENGPDCIWTNSYVINNTPPANKSLIDVFGNYSILELVNTEISGNTINSGNIITVDSSYSQVSLKNGTTLTGNTVNNGKGISFSENYHSLVCEWATFASNTGTNFLNLINLTGLNSHYSIEKSFINNNSTSGTLLSFNNCFEGNIEQSRIEGNTCTSGGILYTFTTLTNVMNNNLIAGNNTISSPVVEHKGGPLSMMHCTISNTTSSVYQLQIEGTGGTTLNLVNNSFTRNNDGSPLINITNNSFNYASGGIYYNQFWDGTAAGAGDYILNKSGTPVDIPGLPGAAIPGSNNIFVSPDLNGNYKPNAGSPLIDSGSGSAGIAVDINNVPRPYNGSYDIGCYEVSGSDPVIHGRVYDSVTGAAVSDCVIALLVQGSSEMVKATKSQAYSFDVFPGNYYFAVTKSGTYFPSQRKASVIAGDHGEAFTVVDGVDITIDLPVDSVGYLNLKKSVNKKDATNGEIVTYGFAATNVYWFGSVTDVKIHEERKSGFKFIPGSVRLNGRKIDDPVISENSYVFDVGTIAARGKVQLSYQCVITTGVVEGSYKSEAICRNSSLEELSNSSAVTVNVVPETLFTNGTLIGRVFMDDNGNGKFDSGEKGLRDVIMATETGVMINSDERGMYHLKNMAAGRHTIQADPSTLPDGYISKNKHGYAFEIMEGSIAKVNIPIIKDSSGQKKDYIFVSLAELTLKDEKFEGNIEMVEKDSGFDEKLDVKGRGAFFYKGKIRGKYLITTSYDSARLSYKQRVLNRNRIFTNLDPDKYYPVYGDGSYTDYSATDTQDALYLLIEWEDDFGKWKAQWGAMEVNWPVYRRTMQGGRVMLESKDKTAFEQTKRKGEVFYALSDHQATHEEFIGTGSSLYHLKHTPVIEGSEKVKIQLRNRLNNLAVQERELVEEIDYSIDYDSGRIVLKRPLTSTIMNSGGSIVSNDILAGLQAIVVVDYEYLNFSVTERDTFGGKVKNYFGDHVGVEAGYAEEERDGSPYRITTTQTTVIVNKDTSFVATYNESEETFSGGGVSYDSGLNFSSQSNSYKDGERGASWSVGGNSLLLEKFKVAATYSEQDAGYNALGTLGSSDTKGYRGSLEYLINEEWTAGMEHQDNDSEADDPTSQALSIVDHLTKTNVYLNLDKKKWDSRLEYTYQDIGRAYTGVRYLGSLSPRGKELMALKLGWKPWERHYYYIIGQATLSEESLEGLQNNMGTVGFQFPFWDRMDLQIEGRAGNIGHSVMANFILNEEGDAQSHVGFETGTQDDMGRFKTVSFSKTYLTKEGVKYNFIKDYSYYNHKVLNGDILDMDIPLSPKWSLGAGYETSDIDEEETANAFFRKVGSFRYNYLDPQVFKLFGKMEWREDTDKSGNEKINHAYIEDEATWYLFEGLSLRAKGALGYAEADETDEDYFNYKQILAGFAWRPWNSDRVNLLGKFIHIFDQPLESSCEFFETSTQKKDVTALDAIIDITDWLQCVEKVAYRQMDEKVGERDWTSSDTWLWINGLNVIFLEKWSVGAEYRILENRTYEDCKSGYLFQVGRIMNDCINMIVGYNFTSFDDDLSNRDEYDREGWFIRLEGRY